MKKAVLLCSVLLLFPCFPPVQTSWETVGRRRVPGKESSSTENKETREKRMDKEGPRGHGEANRRGRGVNHSREGKAEGKMPKKSKLWLHAVPDCHHLLTLCSHFWRQCG